MSPQRIITLPLALLINLEDLARAKGVSLDQYIVEKLEAIVQMNRPRNCPED
jgi:hypothetical protein